MSRNGISMNKAGLFKYIDKRRYAVESTVSAGNKPQSAILGIAVTKKLILIFDTLKSTRKYKNLKNNPNIAFVIGSENETTVQYEGKAREIDSISLRKYKEVYFKKFPEGRERDRSWTGLAHFFVVPKWIRYSDYSSVPEQIVEFRFSRIVP